MNSETEILDLQGLRARKARLANRINKQKYDAFVLTVVLLALGSGVLASIGYERPAYFLLAIALAGLMLAIWCRQDLMSLKPEGESLAGILAGDVLGKLDPEIALTPKSLWQQLHNHWQFIFFTNRLLILPEAVEQELSDSEGDMTNVWTEARRLRTITASPTLEAGHIAGALLTTSPHVLRFLAQLKLTQQDVEAVSGWLGRGIGVMNTERPYFGGIGRDWANGFTPHLNQFGHNVSLSIEREGAHFGWLTTSPGVTAVKNAFSQGASAIALVGESGVGKTSHVYALAQLLLSETHDRHLEHRQIVSLSPSTILASAQRQGELERIIMTLLAETAHAGHIILFFDDAQLFFGHGPGAFDITQILLPVVQSRSVQMIFAVTPHDYQLLKGNNPAFANLLTPVMLTEPAMADVMRILEDTALNLEHRHGVLITYEALREAYRLSGRYDQDKAYPGRAISLLEQSLSYAQQKVVTEASVQAAIEQSRGVKVTAAAPAEADTLLHLEDLIHRRMVNQSRAVGVVANALRRARAGVSNPRRPIGSFLFLGPTGVGKTELAKAIAAVYFGAETNMVRLDMSEYQEPEAAERLLSTGEHETKSLLLSVRQQPFTVVLLDEIEKAHPNILNLLLQMLDEGQLTDTTGRTVSFKDCIVIATSNAGAARIREHIEQGEKLENFESQFTDELVNSGQFKPELLNRFDEIVLFRPLDSDELEQVVKLMLDDVNRTLATQNISVELTEQAIRTIVEQGNDPRLGARPMRRMLQRAVEDGIANRILTGDVRPGDHVLMDTPDLSL